MLLWGSAGCGKTHLANTAPGKRLFISFDPDGMASLDEDDDTIRVDYSSEPDALVQQANSMNPFDIEGLCKNEPAISTVIIDSVTAFSTRAVSYSVGKAPGATFENPGIAGYGFRNRFVLGLAKQVLYVTGKLNKHVIFICHEDVPKTDKEGNIVSITVLLGGSLVEEVPLQISEVWHMGDNGNERRITVRQLGLKKPMKTRMFNTTKGYDFVTSNKANSSRITLATLFDQWRENNYNKIELPQ